MICALGDAYVLAVVQYIVIISSELTISNICVVSISGQQVMAGKDVGSIDVSGLAQGVCFFCREDC